MTFSDALGVATAAISIVLALVAIWLALHHKRESDRTNDAVRNLLLEVKSDAKTIAGVVLPELQKYGDAVRSTVFFQKTRVPEETASARIAIPTKDGGDLTRTLDRFHEVVRAMAEGAGFTNKQRDEVMALARKIHASGGLSNDEAFATSLEQLIDSLASADQSLQVDALANLFSDVVEENAGIIHTLVVSLGMRLLEAPKPPAKVFERFSHYLAVAEKHGIADIAMSFRLVYSDRAGDTKQVAKLFEAMKGWEATQVQQVAEAIERRTDPAHIGQRTNPKILALAQANRDFWEKHGAKLKALYE